MDVLGGHLRVDENLKREGFEMRLEKRSSVLCNETLEDQKR